MFGANHQGAATDPQSIIQQRPSNGAAQQQQQVRNLFLSFILVGYIINKLRIRLKYIEYKQSKYAINQIFYFTNFLL